MATTGYAMLKHHFDKLLVGGYPTTFYGSGLEPIRDTFEKAFNTKINMYDVYQTELKCSHNPLNRIITLIGPNKEEPPITTGIMMCGNEVVNTNYLPDDILKGIEEKDIPGYIVSVYETMDNIVKMDRFYASDSEARNNPYMIFIKCCPFYFTYHHAKDCLSGAMKDKGKLFHDILEKYIVSGEDADKVLESVASTKYSADPEIIYSTMTCKNTVELFW